jgi:hypothetical protein
VFASKTYDVLLHSLGATFPNSLGEVLRSARSCRRMRNSVVRRSSLRFDAPATGSPPPLEALLPPLQMKTVAAVASLRPCLKAPPIV